MPVTTESPTNDFDALQKQLASDAAEIEKWWSQPRWKNTKRIYSAKEIASRKGSFPAVTHQSSIMAQKLYKILEKHYKEGSVCLLYTSRCV